MIAYESKVHYIFVSYLYRYKTQEQILIFRKNNLILFFGLGFVILNNGIYMHLSLRPILSHF